MIDTVLRIVFDNQNRHRLPEGRVAQRLHDLAEREIVVGNACTGCAPAGTRALSMIVGKHEQREMRHLLRRLPFLQVFNQNICLDDVRYLLRPAGILTHQNLVETRDLAARIVHLLERATGPRRIVRRRIPICCHQLCTRTRHRVARRGCILAKAHHALSLRRRRLPEKSTGRICQRIIPFTRITPAVVQWPHRIGRFVRLREPIVPVGRITARRKEVIDEHELLTERMRVWRDIATIHRQRGIACTFADITQHLIVSTIFLDDVNDVIDHTRLARTFRHCTCDSSSARRNRWCGHATREMQSVVFGDTGRVCQQLRITRHCDHVDRTPFGEDVASFLARRLASARTDAKQCPNRNGRAVFADVDATRKPSGWNEAAQWRRRTGCTTHIVDRDSVDAAECCEQRRAVRRERECGRCQSDLAFAKWSNCDGADKHVATGIDHTDRIAVAVRDVEPLASVVPGERCGMQAHGDAMCDLARRDVDTFGRAG